MPLPQPSASVPCYHAYVWWCGDEYCDCQQPRIELRTPNLTVGPPWARITEVWAGTFTSGGNEDGIDLEGELAAECERRGIPVGLSVATDVDFAKVREIEDREMAKAREICGG